MALGVLVRVVGGGERGDAQALPFGGLTRPAWPHADSGSRVREVGIRLGPLLEPLL